MATYLRFETPYHCHDSCQPLGIFMAAWHVAERDDLHEWTSGLLREQLDWFSDNLPAPETYWIDRRAIFWFHPQSTMVSHMWQLTVMLRAEGLPVRVRRTDIPGRIVYQDKYQIAAIPFGHGRRPRRKRPLELAC
jgi:hypothetical protein